MFGLGLENEFGSEMAINYLIQLCLVDNEKERARQASKEVLSR